MKRFDFLSMRLWTRVSKFALFLILLLAASIQAEQQYEARGIVLAIDRPHRSMVVSCSEIPGFMEAMVMSFAVPNEKSLEALTSGTVVDFTLVVGKENSRAENVRVHGYDSAEREPAKARRLQALEEALRGSRRLSIGQAVPDFTLTDQQGRPLHFRQLAGKVIALNFIYTRCALPEYCIRSTNNFGIIQKQFQQRLGKDLVLLTVTFDPVHDGPQTLRNYANTWKADPENWRFLTGPVADVQHVCDLFGVNNVPDEGLFVHSLHSAIVSRDGKLVANLEGNEFTAKQLADLLTAVLDQSH
jgi:protein SCO1/2